MLLLNIIINRLNKFNLHEVLGYLGFFPFVFLIILVSIDKGNLDLYINLVAFYLFIIISFIGAVYWGITITLKKKFKTNHFFRSTFYYSQYYLHSEYSNNLKNIYRNIFFK